MSFGAVVAVRTSDPTKWHATGHVRSRTSASQAVIRENEIFVET